MGVVWCPKCRAETLPHDPKGTCMFCDTLIIRDGQAIYRDGGGNGVGGLDALERMDRGGAQIPARDVPGTSSRAPRTTRYPDQASILAEIRTYAGKHGQPPVMKDMGGVRDALKRLGLNWADLVVEAGFDRPERGKPRAGVTPKKRTATAVKATPPGPKPTVAVTPQPTVATTTRRVTAAQHVLDAAIALELAEAKYLAALTELHEAA